MENKEGLTYNLRILGIKIIKFAQFELLQEINLKNTPSLEYQTQFEFKVFEIEERIDSIITVKIKVVETEEYYAELIVETSFYVNPIKSIVKKVKNGGHEINNAVIYNISSVSLSTIRGILFEKLKGSAIQQEILPLTDLSKIFLEQRKEK